MSQEDVRDLEAWSLTCCYNRLWVPFFHRIIVRPDNAFLCIDARLLVSIANSTDHEVLAARQNVWRCCGRWK